MPRSEKNRKVTHNNVFNTLGEVAKALLLRIEPDEPTGALHAFLDTPFLPAGGDDAEVGVEQVACADRRPADAQGSVWPYVPRRRISPRSSSTSSAPSSTNTPSNTAALRSSDSSPSRAKLRNG